jgi:hypothetical protein
MNDRKITISGHIITAALQMLAILSAVAVFIMDKRDVGFFYYICISLSFLSFILSIQFGAIGIGSDCDKSSFNKQAIFSFLGLIFFFISTYIGIKVYNPPINPRFVIENKSNKIFNYYKSDQKKTQLEILQLRKKLLLLNNEVILLQEEIKQNKTVNTND